MKVIVNGVAQEIKFSDLKFIGKLYGLSYQQTEAVEFLKRIRVLLFVAPIYPIIFDPFAYITFIKIFKEQSFFAVVFIICGLLFKKNPLIVMLIAMIPPLGMLLFLFASNIFKIKIIGFYIAVMVLLGLGIYNFYKEIRLRNVLIKEFKNGNEDVILKIQSL